MLTPEVERELAAIGPTDIVIGVATYNHAETVDGVVAAARDGLRKHFHQARAALVVADAGSSDRTPGILAAAEWDGPRVVMRHDSPPAERVAVPHHGVPGRASAQRLFLEATQRLEARACALLGADCRSPAVEWIDRLLRPILEDGQDYVAPLYQRHRYEGTLTNALIGPLIRALFGKRIRHPVGWHTGLSGRLVAHLAGQDVWRASFIRQGLDLWMTITAVVDGYRVTEAWLGPCVVAPQGQRPTDLSTTFVQAVGPTFALLEHTAEAWAAIRRSEAVPVTGTPLPHQAGPAEVNVARMLHAFRLGVKDLLPLWEQVLSPEPLTEVLALGGRPDEAFRFPHALWARVVYDFVLGYHFNVLYRDHLLRSLIPLYLGRTAAFVSETARRAPGEAEHWLEAGCRAFEDQKRYLVERWQ